MWHGLNNGWGMMWGWGWIFGLVFIVLIVWMVVRITSSRNYYGKRPGDTKATLDILKERYARGEITKKEFEEIKKDILD